MFYYIVSDKNGEMFQRSYSVINRRRWLVDDQQLVKFINIFQPGSRLGRQAQGSQNVPAISSFTFTFSPVKNLSSMGFPTIFMFMWIVIIAFCLSISSYRLLLLLQSTFHEQILHSESFAHLYSRTKWSPKCCVVEVRSSHRDVTGS
jgi:hypothetical protein